MHGNRWLLPLFLPVLLLGAASCKKCGPSNPGRTAEKSWSVAPGRPPQVQARVPNDSSCAPTGQGQAYEVGQGQSISELAKVPWADLGPGDAVRIHWRAEPYREKILISQSGTAQAPLKICGVPDAQGHLPVIDGDRATTSDKLDFASDTDEIRGVLTIAPRHSQRWGYKPSYLVVEGLEIRHAQSAYGFTDSAGHPQRYFSNSAAIFVERGEHVTIEGCVLHDAGNGLFVASGDEEAMLSRDIVVRGNDIFDNGSTGDRKDRDHNVYTEAAGILFELNRIGPLREGSWGIGIKDRSVGTVVRYNWIEGGSRLLDLVEPDDSAPLLTKDPRLHRTLVYGNLLLATKRTSSRIVHYGGDNGDEATYRKGTLYFYANTTIVTADESDNWHTCLLHLETNDESADVRDNILYRVGSTHLAWGYEKGVLKLGANWVSPDVAKGRDNFEGKFEYLDGKNQLTVGDDPGFVDFGKKNFCLRKDSPARGLGQPLASELGQDLAPVRQYQSVGKAIPRAWKGTGDDLGAFACP